MPSGENVSLMLHAQESVSTVQNVEIFVIDDEEDIRYMLRQAMEDENYRVHTAANLIDAEAMIRHVNLSNKIIFVIDYSLPDGNGVQLADDLQRKGVYDGVYILISAGCEPKMYEYIRTWEYQSKIRGSKDCNTIDEVLLKPFSMSQLKDVIKKYV